MYFLEPFVWINSNCSVYVVYEYKFEFWEEKELVARTNGIYQTGQKHAYYQHEVWGISQRHSTH